MKKIQVGKSDIEGANIVQGCMRIDSFNESQVTELLETTLELGMNFYDHSNIYGFGNSEAVFGNYLKNNPSKRSEMIIQSKAGIRRSFFDFSKEHILSSVDESLTRLNTDYLDILLLHRPDALVEPEEVAEAFDILEKSGKVRNFGVSNHTPLQIELLKKYVKQPLVANQLQLSVAHCPMITQGMNMNMCGEFGVERDGEILNYCRINDITIQAWSPLQHGMIEGAFVDNDKFPEINNALKKIGGRYNVKPITVAIAWILRHPAKMQVVVGSTNINRLREIAKANNFELSKEDWYDIYLAAGNRLP